MTWAYLLRCQQDKVMHTEIFFDPQTHTERGIAFATVINGTDAALPKAKQELGIVQPLDHVFLRLLDEEAAFATLEMPCHKDKIIAVGWTF